MQRISRGALCRVVGVNVHIRGEPVEHAAHGVNHSRQRGGRRSRGIRCAANAFHYTTLNQVDGLQLPREHAAGHEYLAVIAHGPFPHLDMRGQVGAQRQASQQWAGDSRERVDADVGGRVCGAAQQDAQGRLEEGRELKERARVVRQRARGVARVGDQRAHALGRARQVAGSEHEHGARVVDVDGAARRELVEQPNERDFRRAQSRVCGVAANPTDAHRQPGQQRQHQTRAQRRGALETQRPLLRHAYAHHACVCHWTTTGSIPGRARGVLDRGFCGVAETLVKWDFCLSVFL